MHFYEVTTIGMTHEKLGLPCSDYVMTFQWNGVTAQACVDGGECASEEARALAAELAQFMAMYFGSLRAMPYAQLAEQMLRLVRGVRADLGCSGTPGCTFVAAAMDTRTRQYLGVALGDGIILAREKATGEVMTLLAPEKRPGGAWRTGDADGEILAHVRAVRGGGKDALLTSSNGLEGTLWDVSGSTLSPTLGKLMRWVVEDPAGVREDFGELVYDLALADDAGLAVMVDSRAEEVRSVRSKPWSKRYYQTPAERHCHSLTRTKAITMATHRGRNACRRRNYLCFRTDGNGRRHSARRDGWNRLCVGMIE